jgi:hypothetical protein
MATIRPYVGLGTPGPDICSVSTEVATIETPMKQSIGYTGPGVDAFHGRPEPHTMREAATIARASDARSETATEIRKRLRTFPQA